MQTVTSKDGTTIAFDRYGTGHAVILVGGAFQHRAIHPGMTELAQTLGRQFTGIYYDRRGRGDSTDTSPYSIDREVEDLQAIIQAVGGTASLFGMSSGGALALEAVLCGLPIRRVAMYEPPYFTEEHQRPEAEEYTHHLNALLAAGHLSEAAAFAMTRMGAPAEAVAEL
ncbi:MAG TPA: alpha/beta hydrolase, partial [Anaerolineaceae bacterium]|nr:alpha/beta hydrolase [Anaerolineaceae bacterium]